MSDEVTLGVLIGIGFVLCLGVCMFAWHLMQRDHAKAEFVFAPVAFMLCAPFSIFPFVNLIVGWIAAVTIGWRLALWDRH